MTEQKRREMYVLARNLWGIQAQVFMVMEEAGEMLNALAKANRGRSSKEEIITELADVSIMVEQMAQHFGWYDFHRERARKLNRLEERINKELAKREAPQDEPQPKRKLVIGQCVGIMVGDKPVGFVKCRMLTCQVEDDGVTKDSGAWENPMRHTYEITGEVEVTNVGTPTRKLLNDMPSKVDVEIWREMGKMPRKMKKAYRTGSRYRRDVKWKRKAKLYERRFIYRLPNAEMVVTREQFGVLEATIKGSGLQYNHAAYAKKR